MYERALYDSHSKNAVADVRNCINSWALTYAVLLIWVSGWLGLTAVLLRLT
jgi:hypothetical protein